MTVRRARGEETPLLIVNADDWGYNQMTTDAILATFDAERISSTSAMIYMSDSERAAAIAKERGLPVGLHLNFTEPFSDPATPASLRERQAHIIKYLGEATDSPDPAAARLRRWVYDPRLHSAVDALIDEQLERFQELYGKPPTHFDGHNHIDLCPNVFLSQAIPPGSKMRNTRDCFPIDRSAAGLARAGRQVFRARRFAGTRYLLHLAFLDLEPGHVDPLLDLAKQMPIEVMAHPAFPNDGAKLMSDTWGEVLAENRVGSFADLDSRPHRLGDWFHPPLQGPAISSR